MKNFIELPLVWHHVDGRRASTSECRVHGTYRGVPGTKILGNDRCIFNVSGKKTLQIRTINLIKLLLLIDNKQNNTHTVIIILQFIVLLTIIIRKPEVFGYFWLVTSS